MSDGFAALTEAAETLFACAVHQRAKHLKPRRGSARGAAKKGVSEFDADKTIRLFSKLWAARELTASEARRLGDLPVTDLDDKHGRRVAFNTVLHDGQDRWDPKTERPSVLDHIISDDQRVAPHLRLLSVDEQRHSWGVTRRITSRTANTHLIRLARQRYIVDSDVAFTEHFGEITGSLSEAEIIALGRHESPEATRDSILFEFKRWVWWAELFIKELASSEVLENKERARRGSYTAWQCWSFAREAQTKVLKERTDYRNAFERFVRLARGTPLHAPFISKQLSESDIWDDTSVAVLCAPAHYCWEASNYIYGTLSHCEAFRQHKAVASATLERAEQARQRLRWFGTRDDRSTSITFQPDYPEPPDSRNSRWGGLVSPSEVTSDPMVFTMRFAPDVSDLVSDVAETLNRYLPRRLDTNGTS